ncbi:MAG TPA: DUF421 domain-containing protein [Firmicutes bacterium]|nr:DUF421 domain-containing protein [Bacillota bacterium]HHY99397.1 DUF421 domain-containing protein [Bacillota bacterium]
MYLFVLLIIRLMGKREVGQLSPFDLVVAIMIADLAALPLEERHIKISEAVIPIIVLTVLEVGMAYTSLKSSRARNIIVGEPTVVIENGRILEGNLKKLRYNLNDLLAQLREKDVHNIADVEYAILETSGKLSVLKKSQKRPVTPEDLKIPTSYEGVPFPLIVDGEINYENLNRLNLTIKWLQDELHKHGCDSPRDVLYASMDSQGNLYVSLKQSAEFRRAQLDQR